MSRNMDPQLSTALSAGLLEMTLGAKFAAECQTDLLQQLMVISFIYCLPQERTEGLAMRSLILLELRNSCAQ